MRKLLSAAILLASVLGLWSCNGENAQTTAPHDNGWNASFRVEAGALTDDQLAQAGWVSAVATRNGIEVARAETTFTAHSVDIHIPTSGDVLLTLTGHVSKTDRTVVWSGAGTLTNGNTTPDKNLVSLAAGPGLVTASSDLTISTSWQGVNLPAGTSYVCGSLIVDPAGISDTVKDSVVFIKDSLSFKKKVKKGSSFRLTLAGKNASLSYNWVIDTTVTTDANASDSTLRLDLASATPVIANTAPVAAEAVPVGRVTAASYVLKLKDVALGRGQSIHYTLDGSIPTLASPAYDAAIGIVMNHPAALADTILPTKVNVSTIMDIGAFDAWQSNVVFSVSWGGTAVSVPRDTTLKSLVATNGRLNTAFDKSILAYTDTVESDAIAAFFSAEPTDPTAEVSGLTVSIGALAAGSTQKSIIRVTNTKNGVASKLEYVVTIYKRPQQVSVDSLLKTLSVAKGTLSPTFDPKVQTYVDEVAAGTTSETIVATAATGATITGTGAVNLTKDTTDVVVGVTNNGAKLDYKVKIVRKAATTVSQDSTLSKLSIAGATLSPAFDKSVLTYTTDSLEATTSAVSVSATATAVGKASITYNGAVSNSITLAAGVNPVVVKVTNGTVSLSYTVKILRKATPVLDTVVSSTLAIVLPSTASTDTAEIRSLTGIVGSHTAGDLSTYSLKTASSEIQFSYDIKMAANTKPYSASARLTIPMSLEYHAMDMKKVTAIEFYARTSAATRKIVVSILSPKYSDDVITQSAWLTSPSINLTTGYQKYTINTSDLIIPAWYRDCAGDCLTTSWKKDATNGATIEIGSAVNAIQFLPNLDVGWNSDGSALKSAYATGDFFIKDLKFIVP